MSTFPKNRRVRGWAYVKPMIWIASIAVCVAAPANAQRSYPTGITSLQTRVDFPLVVTLMAYNSGYTARPDTTGGRAHHAVKGALLGAIVGAEIGVVLGAVMGRNN